MIRNLDPEAIGEIAQSARVPGTASGTGEPVPELDLALLTRVLERSPELEIAHLELEGPDGALHARGKLGIDGASPQVAMGPLMAANAVEAEAELFVPRRLLHEVLDGFAARKEAADAVEPAVEGADRIAAAATRSSWIEALVTAGVLVAEDEGYRVQVEYREGSLRVNGKPFDPTSLGAARVAMH